MVGIRPFVPPLTFGAVVYNINILEMFDKLHR